jgi:hypothetical protein
MKPITTNIPVKRMATRLEGNIGKCVVVGSITARAAPSWSCVFTLLLGIYMLLYILFRNLRRSPGLLRDKKQRIAC